MQSLQPRYCTILGTGDCSIRYPGRDHQANRHGAAEGLEGSVRRRRNAEEGLLMQTNQSRICTILRNRWLLQI